MNPPAGTSLDDLYAFLAEATTRTTLTPGPIDAYRVATRSVQHTLGLPGTVDLRDLDIDQAAIRYRTAAGRLTFHTRATYERNFRRAVRIFLGWMACDRDWQAVPHRQRYGPPPGRTHEIYRLALRRDETLTLYLPRDLTPAEADRIAAFVTTLVYLPPTNTAG